MTIEQLKNDQVLNKPTIRNPRKRLLIAVTICIAVCLVLASIIVINLGPRGMTAFEGKEYADERISLLCQDGALVSLKGRAIANDGRCSQWVFEYVSASNNKSYEISVYENGTAVSTSRDIDDGRLSVEITDWVLDSTDAFGLAKEDIIFSRFRSENLESISDIYLRHLDMNVSGYHINQAAWFIGLWSGGFMDNPKSAEIYIDAKTGEVLHADANLNYNLEPSKKESTAIELKPVADKVIASLDPDAVFIQARASFHNDAEGNPSLPLWSYHYLSPLTRKSIEVRVNSEKQTAWLAGDADYNDLLNRTEFEIKEWVLDSDEAYSVACTNSTFSSFVSEYGHNDDYVMLETLYYQYPYHPGLEYGGEIVWCVEIHADLMSSTKLVRLTMDADTGEIYWVTHYEIDP
ncbi:MAG: hypothetical protein FP824_09870 [Euryarchaeota archaeon]|nr:hypothetical protein [Euryarchaeota archaeon]